MRTNKFFVCPNCGNIKKFKVFTSNFQIVTQSPELGIRMNESGVLPNLRQADNYIECQLCFKKSEYDAAVNLGEKYIKDISNQPRELRRYTEM
ncbi:MAG: hypothetical protein QY310_11350 [Candidatus Jettenia sp. CY-1]|nr:hypothetical protein [Candidatus Jettenia sp.]WKZ18024.1 MAG: hypothetical protein QY310_11350 [Candidatus Jettenia sp. CY-1]